MVRPKLAASDSRAVCDLRPVEFDRRLLEAATQFYQTAEDAGRVDLPHRPDVWLAFPEVVNYAFAAELALKGLHWLHLGQPSRGHDLHKLCTALPDAIILELSERTITPILFLERLAEVRDAFEVWRYAFEKEELCISIDFLQALAQGAIHLLERDAPSVTPTEDL